MKKPFRWTAIFATGAALFLLGSVACGVQPAPASIGSQSPEPISGAADPGPASSNSNLVSAVPHLEQNRAVSQLTDLGFDVVEVSGVGTAVGIPDITSLSLGVSVTADSVSEARSEAAETVQGVIDALTELSISAEDISTVRFTIHPEYDYVQGEQRFKGYQVFNLMQVIVREIEDVGPTIDASIAAGGDNIVFNGLNFSFSDTVAMEREAREAAVQDMADKAGQLALFAGRELGELKKIAETSGVISPFNDRSIAYAATESAAFDTPVLAGEDAIKVYVYGVYELH